MPTISGFTYYSNGNPVNGASINYYAAIEGTPSSSLGSTTTNANGYWEFTSVTGGVYDVKVSWDGGNQVRWHKGLTAPNSVGVSRLLDVVATDVVVTADNTERTLYTFSLPANYLSTYRGVRLTLVGTIVDNNTTSPVLRMKLGASTLIETAGASLETVNNAAARAIKIVYTIYATSAAAQVVCGEVVISNTDNVTTGVGAEMNPAATTTEWTQLLATNTGAVDTTVAVAVAVTWQFAASTVSTLTIQHAALEALG